jgi:diguanylate cyclase (GGDEF)-like protein/PAS domain S-box-containing protein
MWRGASPEQRQILDWIFGASPAGMAVVEYDDLIGGKLVNSNEALEVITGYTAEELAGMPAHRLVPEVSDAAEISRNELVAGKRSWWSNDVDLLTKQGTWKVVRLTVSSLIRAEGGVTYGIAFAEDVTERRAEHSRLEFLAGHDALTGLPGAQRMEEELLAFSHRIVAKSAPRALVVVDIDGFTYLNDRLGYDGGDQVIRGMAGLVESVTADGGLGVRVGANRFAMFWPNLDAGKVVIKISNLLQEIRGARFTAALGEAAEGLTVTASAGIAIIEPGDVSMPSRVLATADQALRKAKQGGRDCLVTLDMNRAPTALTGLSEVRELIARGINDEGTFRFDAQPIVDIGTGATVGHELLLRAQFPDGRLVMPDELIPIAEESGLIRRLDRWVVRKGIELAARGGIDGEGGSIWMNMSAQSLVDSRLADLVEEELRRLGADPSKLTFEMTEREGSADFRGVGRLVRRLREAGCSCALDDFGAGYGGFNHIKQIAFDVIKIDGHFIEELATSEVDQAVVRSIVETAKVAQRRTVAEFVSDDAALELLRGWGVDFAQGFCVAPPVPVDP